MVDRFHLIGNGKSIGEPKQQIKTRVGEVLIGTTSRITNGKVVSKNR